MKTKFQIAINILNSRRNNHKWVTPTDVEVVKRLLKIVGEEPTVYAECWDKKDRGECSHSYSIRYGEDEEEIAVVVFQWFTYQEAREVMKVLEIFD